MPETFLSIRIQPLFDYCVLFSIIGFVIFLAVGVENHGTLSISGMIAKTPEYGVGISLLILFVHSIAVFFYLIIVSKYIRQDVRCGCIRFDVAQYNIIVALCLGYLLFLILAIFVKVDEDNDAHNVFVVIALVLAVASSWIHRHAFAERIEKNEQYLWASEFLVALCVTILGVLFIALEENVLEYVLIILLLLDKKLKIMALTQSGLLNAFDLIVNVVLEEVSPSSESRVIPQSSIF